MTAASIMTAIVPVNTSETSDNIWHNIAADRHDNSRRRKNLKSHQND
jgi:hypothetical protein